MSDKATITRLRGELKELRRGASYLTADFLAHHNAVLTRYNTLRDAVQEWFEADTEHHDSTMKTLQKIIYEETE